ncbi:hypothetical protein BU24DRAFT_131110 [Aaosphaeria arxii CBS 175.79]|uniref:Uncharacterized protein n=1 Tax=Aaosphaeria arxii CBS 175.79 TaxID=1450172 RepID=A0A6A5Y3Z6_9PLEO|nr:uncharacterized protein BU24DRAFT_131110 [Aaosphaeria arxii CBS 175.79]KAF2019999.1 hypothetical protein BU24DRAFT_131110 [Aaosphaeria arxii CBS 175.79]
MRRRVIELFACSLRMCAIAIRDPKHRFKTWVATLIGESDADEELAEFRRIEHDLLESINMWTLAEVTGIRKGLQRSSTISSKWQELLVWLSRVDFLGKYNELIDRVHERPRAGRWLLESEPFVKWRDQDEDRLWYTGKRELPT